MKHSIKLLIVILMVTGLKVLCQPNPGDLFREYIWLPEMVQEDEGRFLRVGGNLDYKINSDHLPQHRHRDGYIPFERYIDLEHAVKVEVMLEKVGSHEDTKNLRISINQHPFITAPNAAEIPAPESDYMHHTYPTIEIPLTQLNNGMDNSFRLEVDTSQRWNWPQNLIYGVLMRVYYDTSLIAVKTRVTGVERGQKLGDQVLLHLDDPNQNINKVEYLGLYEGINFEGDGVYRQWQFHYFRGVVMHHIGYTNSYPYSVLWNTSWVPDQTMDIQIAARVKFNSGLIYFTQPIIELSLSRGYKVELCKPYEQPKNWVTRVAEFQSKIDITGDVDLISEARLYWTSWSPCYSNGIYINEVKVFEKEGPCYEYMAHEVPLVETTMLKYGENIIKTGKEPLHNGEIVHGMEVQWPGIMMLIKYHEK